MSKNRHHEKPHVENFLLVLSCAVILLLVSFFFIDAGDTRAKNPLKGELTVEQKLKQFKPEGKERGDNILADTDKFNVTYLISHKEFIVEVKTTPVSGVSREVEAWFGLQGFSGDELCQLKVSVVPSREIMKDFTEADTSLPSCR